MNFLRHSKVPVYTIRHTLEISELKGMGYIGKARALAEQLIGPISLQYTSDIIGVTNEITQYEYSRLRNKNKFVYTNPNGINLLETKTAEDFRNNIPQILFIASYFADWHGLDLLLEDLCHNKSNFILHIVGKTNQYQRILADNDTRVVFHEHMSKKEIRKLASFCTVGLSSFALHRKNMKEACTLKVREYLSLGIPVYAGHKDVFPKTFKYYHYGPPRFDEIIRYSNSVKNTTRLEVKQSSRHLIDKDILLANLYRFLATPHSINMSQQI